MSAHAGPLGRSTVERCHPTGRQQAAWVRLSAAFACHIESARSARAVVVEQCEETLQERGVALGADDTAFGGLIEWALIEHQVLDDAD